MSETIELRDLVMNVVSKCSELLVALQVLGEHFVETENGVDDEAAVVPLRHCKAVHQRGFFVIERGTEAFVGNVMSQVYLTSKIGIPQWKAYRILRSSVVNDDGIATSYIEDLDGTPLRLMRCTNRCKYTAPKGLTVIEVDNHVA